jgi:hypothetical protein
MAGDESKPVEWVPLADGNADALFVFDVQQAVSDPYNEVARKFIEKIPTLAVQCLKCGRMHPFAARLKGCPVCSRTSYAYRGTPSRLNVVCTQCGAGVLESVQCECGSVNPLNGTTLRKPKAKGGCFVATAACGDPFAPEVIALSAFRDEVLLRNQVGCAFVRLYYAVSPPIAAVIARSNALRQIVMLAFVRPTARTVAIFRNALSRKGAAPKCRIKQ